jgi:S-adenosylmethionine:tRNA ribosyltransferase-isomerase
LFNIADYDFNLPPGSIAQHPVPRRDESRLLILKGGSGGLEDGKFSQLVELVQPGDLLVLNDTRVFPARLLGHKESGGRVELLVLDYPRDFVELPGQSGLLTTEVFGLLKSSKRPRAGAGLVFAEGLTGEVLELLADGKVRAALYFRGDFAEVMSKCGRVPLPPYIRREEDVDSNRDRERYQTVYAREPGAVAAPTAGLHFTEGLLADIAARGVGVARVTLHVGYGTFAPVRVKDIRQHRIHREYVSIPALTAELVNRARRAGGRIWAVGTTTVRALEAGVGDDGCLEAGSGWRDLYIYPGYRFRLVDNLITNFHLPRSSLLFMVSALVGRERLLEAYNHAVRQGYRFYSYGDAMVIIS